MSALERAMLIEEGAERASTGELEVELTKEQQFELERKRLSGRKRKKKG